MFETRFVEQPMGPLQQAAYRYFLEYRDGNDRLLGDEPIPSSEFDRAIYATFFDGVREGVFPAYTPSIERARIEPRFDRSEETHEAADLRAVGFSVVLPAPNGNEYRVEFPSAYFASRANRRKLEFVRSETISHDAVLRYKLTAFLDDLEDAQPKRQSIQLGSASVAVKIQDAPAGRPGCEPWDEPDLNELGVSIPKSLLEDAVEEARDHAENEIGGFLLGHLRRGALGNLLVEVTGLVSAHGTAEATATTVTFTPESFARAHEMIALRGAGEIICGHYHSHPFRVCSACPLPMLPECVAKILFFSQDDIDLMSSTFAQPWMLGLLCAVEPRLDEVLGHLPVRLYGWRRGQLVARGFHVIAHE